MLEPRPVLILLIGLMLFISLYYYSVPEAHIGTEYSPYETIELNTHNFNAINDSAIRLHTTLNLPTLQTNAIIRDDEHILINLNDFDYLLNQPACEIATTPTTLHEQFVLLLIHSAPRNWQKRNVIRDTWGQHDPRARIFFILGAVNSSSVQNRLRQENNMFQDIIQGNFLDAYRNMTYKHMMALKWFVFNCPKLKYLIKADDDVFINTPALYNFLAKSPYERDLLFCFKNEGARIKRSYRSKWRVSTKEYSGWYYPPYCPGFSIVYSADVVFRLYDEGQRTRYFWIDDVHVTGTLAQRIGLNITALGKFYLTGEERDNIFNGNSNLTKPMFLFTQPNLVESQIRKLWKLIMPKTR